MSEFSTLPFNATIAFQQSDAIFATARTALTYISTFRTPPTPDVYEVWYRFAEGGNQALNQQLTFAVEVAKSVSAEQLKGLQEQFLSSSKMSDGQRDVSDRLVSEMDGLQSLLTDQLGQNSSFGVAIENVLSRFGDEGMTQVELNLCVKSILHANELLQKQLAETDERLESSRNQVLRLRNSISELSEQILLDPHTGVGNRNLFDQEISKTGETAAWNRYLLLVDIDDFKRINDCHGHATGDDVLRYVANYLAKRLPTAKIARYGGDEFAVFVDIAPEEVAQLALEICDFFSRNELTVRNSGNALGALTLSLGAAELRAEDNADTWFERADQLLLNAKSGGRNRCMIERIQVLDH